MTVLKQDVRQLIRDSVDVDRLLRTLGFQIFRVTSSEIRAPCILHGGDNPTAFSIRLDNRRWKCFTRQCENDALGNPDNDVIALVMRCLGLPFMDALRYLAEFTGLGFDPDTMFVTENEESRRRKRDTSFVKAAAKLRDRHEQLPELSETVVAEYIDDRDDYFLQFGFQPATLETFEIGAKVDRHGVRRATVPIRDASGKLVSVSARREDGDDEPRYLLDYAFQKGRILYNLHNAIATGEDTIILVEGFKALWSVYEAGYHNVAACMGARITDEQVLTLCSTHFTKCLVLFDGDQAGQDGIVAALPKIRKYFRCEPLFLPDKISPDSIERVELKELIDLYINIF
jgi:DNA primase